MIYITLNDLVNTVRNNLSKIPHDIDFVVGVVRSGMLAATIIAEYLNVPLVDDVSYAAGISPAGGNRIMFNKKKETGKVLVIDDTCYSGKAMRQTKELLKHITDKQFIYACVFLEADPGRKECDLWLEDISSEIDFFKGQICLYEWNIFHHYNFIMERSEFDMDGVLCLDPPDDHNEEEYEKYIKDATPLFIPTSKIQRIVSYRINKYRDITEEWLLKNNVNVNELILFDADNREKRNTSGISPELFKAVVYKNHPNDILFFESDDYQARFIHNNTGKAVYCVGTNKMYCR